MAIYLAYAKRQGLAEKDRKKAMARMDVYVFDKQLIEHETDRVLGTFSSHWAACEAMLRLNVLSFRSLGGDKREDLAVESSMPTADPID